MTDFPGLQRGFVQALVKVTAPVLPVPATPPPPLAVAATALGGRTTNLIEQTVAPSPAPASASAGMAPLPALVNALPYFGDLDFLSAHRGALVNLLETSLPNDPIAGQPDSSGLGNITLYSYTGPYSGYRAAFFPGVFPSPAAAAVASATGSASSALSATWWGQYAVAVLTDAMRLDGGASIDTGSLANALSSFASQLRPALSASYLAVLQTGYSPTANALARLVGPARSSAATALTAAIREGQFTANVNVALSTGGDFANAAVWFLYNVWMALAALGADVDSLIPSFQSTGLTIPAEVGASSWWNGGYSSWFIDLSGSDVAALAAGSMSASFPESEDTAFAGGDSSGSTSVPNGYVASFCNWGPLAQYNPPPASCFAAGTEVLMADGSTRRIEAVRRGDSVLTDLGPRRVALVEAPQRRGRPLFRINGLSLRVSRGHPFQARDRRAGQVLALDPWLLLDAVPTCAPLGVVALDVGRVVAGRDVRGEVGVTVEAIDRLDDASSADECVYDLVLEGWGAERAAYYVGGPERFLAAYPETADPSVDLPSAVAVATTIRRSIEACRRRVADPAGALGPLVAQLRPEELHFDVPDEAGRARGALEPSAPQYRLPGLDSYLRDGRWCPHASHLEAALVRQLGRRLRSCTHRCAPLFALVPEESPGETRLAVAIHELQWVGEGLPGDAAATSVVLGLQRRGAPEVIARVDAAQAGASCALVDEVVDLGPSAGPDDIIAGRIERAGTLVARFRCPVWVRGGHPPSCSPHFSFGAGGRVLGWISLTQRRVAPSELEVVLAKAARWNTPSALRAASALGARLGDALSALFDGLRQPG